jgi:predicted house-cleaning noncanonical NTP pyrophosphatase (MazG superfamily)
MCRQSRRGPDLPAKPLEEAREAQAAPDGHLASELADVLEVLKVLAAARDPRRELAKHRVESEPQAR